MLTLEGTQAPSSYVDEEEEERFLNNLDKDQKEWEQIFRAHELEMKQLKGKHHEAMAEQKSLVEYYKGQADHDKHAMTDLDTEKAQVVRERETLLQEKENLLRERETLLQEKESLLRERESLPQEKESLLRERETLLQEKAGWIQEKKQSDREKLEMLDEIRRLSGLMNTASDTLAEHKRSRFI